MRALVTGGAGFVGTNLIKRLSNNNHVEYRENIIASVDNYSTGLAENEIDCPGVRYFGGDISQITDYSDMIEDCDVIFHLAARARIQPSFKTPIPMADIFCGAGGFTQGIIGGKSGGSNKRKYGVDYLYNLLLSLLDYTLSSSHSNAHYL